MKALALVLLAGLGCGLSAQTKLKEGDKAPDFTLPSTMGKEIRLSDFAGKQNVVLAFFPAAFTGG